MSTISLYFLYFSQMSLLKEVFQKFTQFPDDLFFIQTDVSGDVLYYKFPYWVFNIQGNSKFHNRFAFVLYPEFLSE